MPMNYFLFLMMLLVSWPAGAASFKNLEIEIDRGWTHAPHLSKFFKTQLNAKLSEVKKPKGWSATGQFSMSSKHQFTDQKSFAWVESKYRTGLLAYEKEDAIYFYTQFKEPPSNLPAFSGFERQSDQELVAVPQLHWKYQPAPPLEYLPYWLKGLPHPEHPSTLRISAEGQLLSLTQQKWTVYYLNWYASKIQLPKTLILESPHQQWQWKWSFDDWAWGDPSESPNPALNTL